MPFTNRTFKRIDNDTIEIGLPGGDSVQHDKNSLALIIANIRRSRMQYATPQAFQKDMNLYTSALQFLRANGVQ